jgi:spindle assembly abnormal protein 6
LIQITDEDDLYFLYTLEIGEHDFHNLKRDQKLVTDFAGFTKKFIDLIRLCINRGERSADSSHDSISPCYISKLDMTTGVFSIVQVNEFNHVNHLSLQFRPGNDASIKLYLASSLQLALCRGTSLRATVSELERDTDRLHQDCEQMAEELRTLRERSDRDMQTRSNEYAQEMNSVRRGHMEEVEVLRRDHEADMGAQRAHAEAMLKEMSDKNSTIDGKLSGE